MTLAELVVKISADTKGFEKEMRGIQKSWQRTGASLADTGRMLTVGVTAPLVAAGSAAVKMAMEAVESENLFKVSMGGMANAARVWSEDLRKSLGLNSYELRRQVGVFNSMFTSMGLGSKASYDLSTGLTKLAYDMASFYNIRPDEALEKLRSGIVGEVEPLRALGVVVDEATVKVYAYTHGIATQGTELTTQQKVLARYGAIMDQTSKAQGDLARTADSPTNRLRVLRSQVEYTATSFGMALLPAFQAALEAATPLAAKLGQMAEGFSRLRPSTRTTIIEVTGAAAVLGPLSWAVGKVITNLKGLATAFVTAAATAGTMAASLREATKNNPTAWFVVLTTAAWAYVASLQAAFRAQRDVVGGGEDKRADAYRELGDIGRLGVKGLGYSLGLTADSIKRASDVAAGFQPPPVLEKGPGVIDIFNYKLERLERAWELFTLTTRESATAVAYQTQLQESLQARLQLVTDQLHLTEAAYSRSTAQTGLWSSATMELGKNLDDLRIKQAELQKQIEDTTKAMQKQSGFMVKEGHIYQDTGRAWVEVGQQGTPEDPYGGRDQAEVDAIARRQNVDISTAASMYDANQDALKKGDIPKYHTGGIFTAPAGRTEGLALLRDGETVLPTGARAQNVYNINATIHVSGARSPEDTAAAVAEEVRRLRLAH